MAEVYNNNPEALVLIRPDERVPTGRTVEVLGYVTSVGLRHYGIAAKEPEGS